MKKKLSQWFAAIVAIAAVIFMLIEVGNLIHMMGIHSTEGGFSVIWKEDDPWQFIASMRSWWYWIMGVVSLLFLCICWEKREQPSKPQA